jgi:hypothetical protein
LRNISSLGGVVLLSDPELEEGEELDVADVVGLGAPVSPLTAEAI